MNIADEKIVWRKRMIQQREALSEYKWESLCSLIHERLWAHPIWKKAEQIATYFSVNKEVNTHAILERGWSEGKKLFVPKCDPETKYLQFYQIEDTKELTGQYYGIPEPDPSKAPRLKMDQLDLVIVPGLVFDRSGYRIGYGGGYYDRFLASIPQEINRVSLAFSFQVTDSSLPKEKYDQHVDYIITDSHVLTCSTSEKKYGKR